MSIEKVSRVEADDTAHQEAAKDLPEVKAQSPPFDKNEEKKNEDSTPQNIRMIFTALYGDFERSRAPVKKPKLSRSQSLPTVSAGGKRKTPSIGRRRQRNNGERRTNTKRRTSLKAERIGLYNLPPPLVTEVGFPRLPPLYEEPEKLRKHVRCEGAANGEEDGLFGLAFIDG